MDNINGTMSMSGTIGEEPVEVSGPAYSLLDYFDREGENELDDLQVGLLYQGEYLGLEIESPGQLASGRSYSLKSFLVEVEGELAGKYYGLAADGDPEVPAADGTLSVQQYDGSTFIASYHVIFPDGKSVSGSINVNRFDTRVR